MKYRNIVIVLIAAIGVSAVVKISTVLATTNEKNVRIESTKGKNEGIFSEKDGMWQPGMSKKSEFFIENNSNKDIKLKKFTFDKSFLKNYKSNKEIFENDKEYNAFMDNSFIEICYKGMELYSGNFKDTFKEKKVELSEEVKLNSGEKKIFDITISLSKDMNNDAKALKKEFILGIIYEYEEESELTDNLINYKNIALGSDDIYLQLINENMLTKPLKEEA